MCITVFEKIEAEYLKERRHYEAKTDAAFTIKHKGLQTIEALAQAAQYYVKQITDDPTVLTDGLQALYSLSDAFQADCQKELRQLDHQLEELEINYRRQLQKEQNNP